jgi:hypothetical protein
VSYKPLFSDTEEYKKEATGAPRCKDGTVVSFHDWECIAVALGFSSAVDMFRTFKNADDRREEWLMWNADKAIANHERSR